MHARKTMKTHCFLINFWLTVAQINSKLLNGLQKDGLLDLNLLNKQEHNMSNDIDVSVSDEYYSEEIEKKRIYLDRRIFEIAGAKFTPLLKFQKVRKITEDMRDM